jgi:MSHA biogenesis protein MshG
MTLYAYKGRSMRGEAVTGQLEADTIDGVASRLMSSGVTPIEILEHKASASGGGDVGEIFRKLGVGKPKTTDLILFSRQMYTITKSGVPLLRGMRGLADSTQNAVLREALVDIITSLEAGRDLASSFSRHPKIFPTLYVSILRVGEETGTMDAAFLRICEYLSQDQDVNDRVKAAMRYPIMVIIAICGAMAIITMKVIPNFAPLFKELGDDIPMPTRILMGTSSFAQHYWGLVLVGLAATVIVTRQYISTEKGRYNWDRSKLRLPVVGKLIHEAILSRITRSLSISLEAGMPMIQTLNVISRSAGNAFMAERVDRLRDAVERGDPLSRAAHSVGLFTPLIVQMMAVGEETGELTDLLNEVSDFYKREVDYTLKNLSSLIEPILIVIIGAMVLMLALGVFLPLWNMIAKAGGH